jgi:hypothetical protein
MPNAQRTLASKDGTSFYHNLDLIVKDGSSFYRAIRSYVTDWDGSTDINGNPVYKWFYNRVYPASTPTETPSAPTATAIVNPAWRVRVDVPVAVNTLYGQDVRLYRNSDNASIAQAILGPSSTSQSVNFDFDSSWNGVQVYARTHYITAQEYQGPASSASNITTITDLA